MTMLLLQVCQHPHSEMRGFAAGALTMMVKAALKHKCDPPLHQQPVGGISKYALSLSFREFSGSHKHDNNKYICIAP